LYPGFLELVWHFADRVDQQVTSGLHGASQHAAVGAWGARDHVCGEWDGPEAAAAPALVGEYVREQNG
jgi:hypothetical protein